MVNHQHPGPSREKSLDTTFLALADPTRRAILAVLHTGDASVSELARPHKMSMPAVMKHIGVLERAGLVSHHKTGRTRRCHLVASPMQQASAWLGTYKRFWEGRLDALERFLEATSPEPNTTSKPNEQE